eukprot:1152154-Pelagomonas_calceolata.AAC.4
MCLDVPCRKVVRFNSDSQDLVGGYSDVALRLLGYFTLPRPLHYLEKRKIYASPKAACIKERFFALPLQGEPVQKTITRCKLEGQKRLCTPGPAACIKDKFPCQRLAEASLPSSALAFYFYEMASSLKEKKITKVVNTLPTSIKETRIPSPKVPCIPFIKRNKINKSMGIRRVTSSSPCLILVTKIERSLLKSASGARKFISVLDGMGMKQSKPGGCSSVKTKLFKPVVKKQCLVLKLLA